MYPSYLLLLALSLWGGFSVIGSASAENNRHAYVFLDPTQLQTVKQQLKQQVATPQTRLAYRQLLSEANKVLQAPNPSVTQKLSIPPSGSRHDYMSLSAYWWPDPEKEDGLPWIRRDGQVNPASKNEQSDGVRLAAFTEHVQALTLAWYFSDKPEYANKAISMIRTWFIEPATRMNPNLNYAQGIPGIDAGRGAGVLDGRYFSTRIVDSLVMLRQSPKWTAQDEQKMHQWMNEYLSWLQTSRNGKKEATAKNNHGSWYAVQVAGIAWYLKQPALVKAMVELQRQKLDHQLAADGSQPEELARTRSFHYSYFNLQAVTSMAILADKVGENLWKYRTAKGSGLIAMLDFMAPYLDENKLWPHKTLDLQSSRLIPLMLQADAALAQPRYQQQIIRAGYASLLTGAEDSDAGKSARNVSVETRRNIWLLSPPTRKQLADIGILGNETLR